MKISWPSIKLWLIYNFKYDAWEKLDKTNNFKTCITGWLTAPYLYWILLCIVLYCIVRCIWCMLHVFKIKVTVVWSMEQFGSWNALYIILFHYFCAECYQNVSFWDSCGFSTRHFFLLSAIFLIVYFISCHEHKSISEHWILWSFKVLSSCVNSF